MIEMDEMKGRGKRGLLRVVFGRTMFFLLFIALQLAFFFWIYVWLDNKYQAWGYGSFALISAILTIHILNEKQNASFKMAWLIPVLLFPVFGTLFYVFVQLQMETKIFAKRIAEVQKRTDHFLEQDTAVYERLSRRSRRNANLSLYMKKSGGYPTWDRTNFKYFPLGDEFYTDVLQELQKARRYIFVEYFIISKGILWDSILKILEQKAKEGVEVRILYDGMNSFSNLPHDYPKELEAKGIRCRIFNPIRPAISTSQNNRDHRKILVIDGHTAYTGGVNLADEYINAEQRFGYWKDAALRIEGDAAWSFTVMFLNFWNAFRPSETDYSAFRPQHSAHPVQDGIVQPYADSPLDEEPVAETVYLNLLARAEQYVYIYTPYLAVGEEMLDALEAAPHRCNYDGLTPVPAVDGRYCFAPVTHKVTLGEIVDLLEQFHAQPATLVVPEIPAGSFAKKLYSTYLSYLPKERIAFPLKVNADERGSFTELLKTENCGQFSVNISKPGITKGQHWHNTKWEFFIVVSGHGLIQERKVGCDEVMEFEVWGNKPTAVQMLPGCTHNIINLSDTENLVTLMWANEPFDPAKPDTFFLKV